LFEKLFQERQMHFAYQVPGNAPRSVHSNLQYVHQRVWSEPMQAHPEDSYDRIRDWRPQRRTLRETFAL